MTDHANGFQANTARLASLDMLRFVAAWGVAAPHFLIYYAQFPQWSESFAIIGVEIFFVLSGFVLGPQIVQCLREANRQTYGRFLIRRWMRTVPPFLLALCCATILFGDGNAGDLIRYVFYIQNFFRQANAVDYFSIAWSLSVEEWYYIVFPVWLFLLVRLALRRTAGSSALFGAIAFIGVIASARLIWGGTADWGGSVRRIVVFRLDSIAYGFVLFILLNRDDHKLLGRVGFALASAMMALSFALCLMLVFAIADDKVWAKQLFPFVAPCFGMSAVLFALKLDAPIEMANWTRHLSLAGGRMSYSIYLFHTIILALLGPAVGFAAIFVKALIYVIALTLFPIVFYRTFEAPILRLRARSRAADLAQELQL